MEADDATARVIADMFGVPQATITRSTTAADVPGWDSLSHAVLIMRLETEFAQRIDPSKALHAQDVGQLTDLFASA